jgi:tRNA pseudouridine38-40 synthase
VTLFGPEVGAPAPPLVRVRLTVAYDGRGFHGFAAQDGIRTVGGELALALRRALRHDVNLTCAGRTDRGVHALGQVVSFDAEAARFDADAMQKSVNSQLAPAIVVRDAAVADPCFDARRSALSRRYRYLVLNRAVPDPFLAPTSWHVGAPLDLRAMQAAGDALIGEHDFTSFCRSHPGGCNVRRVLDLGWHDVGEGVLRFEIEASSFCQQMVRSVVGTMVDMGRGRRRAGEMTSILRARSRTAAGQPAPPHGLTLWSVRYSDD